LHPGSNLQSQCPDPYLGCRPENMDFDVGSLSHPSYIYFYEESMSIPDLDTLAEHLEDKLVPVCLANGPLAAFMIGNAKEIFHTSNPGHAQLLVCVGRETAIEQS